VRIAVFCGSSQRAKAAHRETARALGRELASRGHVLIFGGGRTGLMGAVADAALEHGGRVQGVILREFIEKDVHHLGLEELYSVDDMRSRKAGLDARADAFVALPGGLGTLEELAEILSFRKLALHHRILVLLDPEDYYAPLRDWIEAAVAAGYEGPEVRGYFAVTPDPGEAVDLCERARLSPQGPDSVASR